MALHSYFLNIYYSMILFTMIALEKTKKGTNQRLEVPSMSSIIDAICINCNKQFKSMHAVSIDLRVTARRHSVNLYGKLIQPLSHIKFHDLLLQVISILIVSSAFIFKTSTTCLGITVLTDFDLLLTSITCDNSLFNPNYNCTLLVGHIHKLVHNLVLECYG